MKGKCKHKYNEFSSTANALEKKCGSEILHFQIEFPGTDRFDRCVILNGLFGKIVFLQQQLECQKEHCQYFTTKWNNLGQSHFFSGKESLILTLPLNGH